MNLNSLPVYKDPHIPKVNEDGAKVLAILLKDSDPTKSKVLVHPDHWDEFCATYPPTDGVSAGSDGEIAVWSGATIFNIK